MRQNFDLNDLYNGNLKVLDDLTSNVKQIQDDLLKEILTLNAETEYLQRFLHGSSDKELFKTNLPVVTYEDVRPYIDRVANGEPFDVLSAMPITGLNLSSGTSGGKQKRLPLNDKYLKNMRFIYDIRSLIISKHVDGVEQGKGLMFLFTRPESKTSSGLLTTIVSTTFFKSKYFKDRPSYWYNSFTSPDEVFWCLDNKQGLYCHFLCGLVQRDDVVRVGALFSSLLIRAFTFLENNWRELCSNIRSGQVSTWVTDPSCRESVSKILRGPNPELADFIEEKCSQKSWQGIIRQLWPNAKFIESVFTGQMAQYVPTLEFYSNKLPLVSTTYGASESFFGVNVNPLCKPQDVTYTFMPNISYFEFLHIDEGNNNEIVELANVKLGHYYAPVVTTFAGLYRYKVDDILEVTGFHNNAPQFRFARRKNVVLSIQTEATTEDDLLNAVTNAKLVLESTDLMLMDFTSYADISTAPGHYVLYWELKTKNFNNNNLTTKLDEKVFAECCYVVEESLDPLYRKERTKDGTIGALEIRVVQNGTFDALMDFFISRGGSISQYKTPVGIKSSDALAVLENKVLARFFSIKSPPLDP
ncbi:hypothetical protein AALP_AA5G274100 [Arabis alpina]|uniref:Uncharacterized protein n=1 Tax=Arabis alpina TaxID=50452 RepID=A0A087GZQ4_ARAAL|nr:hypothetical protein AALP_AA5G274100 [Arabis alpina]